MFGTVFPQEHLFRNLKIGLSESFILEDRADDVKYTIVQKPKCYNGTEYYPVDPVTHGCREGDELPLLCPYVSLTPDDAEDTNLPAFHQGCGEASGTLTKSKGDEIDEWIIDLAVPCFEGQCDQGYYDWVKNINCQADPWVFDLPIGDEHKIFGCDLWVEVNSVSRNYIDKVDIGDETSEAGHNLSWWGPVEPDVHGGGWGEIAPGNCRVIYASSDNGDGTTDAYLTLDFGPEPTDGERYLVLRNLDGQALYDNFDVYLNDQKYAYYVGNSDQTETWKTTYAKINEIMPSIIEIRLVSTNAEWGLWSTYGQVGFDWIMTTNTIPDGAQELLYY